MKSPFKNLWQGTENLWLSLFSEFQSGDNFVFSQNGYENISSVYTSVKILAEALSTSPVFFYNYDTDKGKIKNKEDNRHYLLHTSPNGYQTSQVFFSTLEVLRDLTGNSYARIFWENGTPKSLKIIPPDEIDNTTYTIGNDNLFFYHQIDERGKLVEKIESSNLLHFKGISKDGFFGLSPISALNTQLSTTYAGYKTLEKHYKSGARPSMLLKSSIQNGKTGKNTDTAIDEFEKKIRGLKNVGNVVRIPLNSEPIPWTVSIEDAKILDTIKFNKNDIASLFGVPPHLVGNYEASKFNNVEQLQLNFKVNTMRQIANIYRRELEFKLLTRKELAEGKSIEFNLDAMVEADQATRIDSHLKKIRSGIMTQNEAAKYENLPTHEGGDKYYIGTDMLEADISRNRREMEIEKLKTEIEKMKIEVGRKSA